MLKSKISYPSEITMKQSPIPYDDTHDLIKQDRLNAFFQMVPEFGTLTGYHAYDHLLGHGSRESLEQECRFLSEWLFGTCYPDPGKPGADPEQEFLPCSGCERAQT